MSSRPFDGSSGKKPGTSKGRCVAGDPRLSGASLPLPLCSYIAWVGQWNIEQRRGPIDVVAADRPYSVFVSKFLFCASDNIVTKLALDSTSDSSQKLVQYSHNKQNSFLLIKGVNKHQPLYMLASFAISYSETYNAHLELYVLLWKVWMNSPEISHTVSCLLESHLQTEAWRLPFKGL